MALQGLEDMRGKEESDRRGSGKIEKTPHFVNAFGKVMAFLGDKYIYGLLLFILVVLRCYLSLL